MTSAFNSLALMINIIMRESPAASILTNQRITLNKHGIMNGWLRSGGTKSSKVCGMKAIYTLTLLLLGSYTSF